MMTRSNLPLAAMAAVVVAASPVAACSVPEETAMAAQNTAPVQTQAAASVEEVYGLWDIRAVAGDARCRVALSGQRDGTAYAALIENCAISALAVGTGWRPVVGGFELLGSDGRAIQRFRMTGLDAFEAVDGRFRGERTAMR